jgi:putative toxin-antitoxin system antitoxin component (TIGR02293 family)
MVRSVWDSIGVPTDGGIDAIKRGLPIQHLEDFLKNTQLPRAAVLDVLQLKIGDVEAKHQLTQEQSERLWRLASIYQKSLTLLEGNAERTKQWLNSPQKALGDVSPLNHIVTEPGAAQVQELIGRIEYGVLS